MNVHRFGIGGLLHLEQCTPGQGLARLSTLNKHAPNRNPSGPARDERHSPLIPQPLLNAWRAIADRWQTTAEPDPTVVTVIVIAIAVLSIVPASWRLIRQAATIVHEMGHVLAAWVTGRRVAGIKLHTDASGVTISRGKPRGFGMLLTTVAGYPAPGLLALGLAGLLTAGYSGAALTLYQALMILALLLSRNLVGAVSCIVAVAATGFIWWTNDPQIVTHTVAALAIFYAIAGVRGTLTLIRVHSGALRPGTSQGHRQVSRQNASKSDAAQAARISTLIPVPTAVWILVFLAVSTASALGVGWMILA